MADETYNPYETSTNEPIDLCEGHEEELNGIIGKLSSKGLSHVERVRLQGRAELLNGKLDERNRRLDGNYFNWER